MEWIDALRGSTVGLDTGPLIYYIEEHPAFLAKIKPFFEAAERNEFRIVTSFVTLVEVLVHPLREGRPELAEEYRDILLRSPALTAIPLDEGIAEGAAARRPGCGNVAAAIGAVARDSAELGSGWVQNEIRRKRSAWCDRRDIGNHDFRYRPYCARKEQYGSKLHPRNVPEWELGQVDLTGPHQ